MKPFLIIIAILGNVLLLSAQDSWQVILNHRNVLTTSVSDESKNQKMVKTADWKSTGYLEIKYKDKSHSNWKHLLEFTDESGTQIFTKDSVTARVPLKTLSKLYMGKKELKIYMMINPPNPMMAAPSRRVHLVTLKLP
jgi:ligand-binding SRPBCC domain-containing protein